MNEATQELMNEPFLVLEELSKELSSTFHERSSAFQCQCNNLELAINRKEYNHIGRLMVEMLQSTAQSMAEELKQ